VGQGKGVRLLRKKCGHKRLGIEGVWFREEARDAGKGEEGIAGKDSTFGEL